LSIRLTDENWVALYDDVTGRPLPLPVFERDHVQSFLTFVGPIPLARLGRNELDALYNEWWAQQLKEEVT
jgi:hypothetical protein